MFLLSGRSFPREQEQVPTIRSVAQSIFEDSFPKTFPICRFQRTPCSFRETVGNRVRLISLATSYSRTTYRSTTIGAAAFHFRVRNGNGWGHCATITRKLAKPRLARGGMGGGLASTSPEILTTKVIGNVVRGCGSTWINRS